MKPIISDREIITAAGTRKAKKKLIKAYKVMANTYGNEAYKAYTAIGHVLAKHFDVDTSNL